MMKPKKINKMYKIQPREKRGRIYVVAFFVLVCSIFVGVSQCCSTDPSTKSPLYLASQLITLATPIVPLYIALYLIYVYKSWYGLPVCDKFLQKISVPVLVVFLLIFLIQGIEPMHHALFQSFAAIPVLILFQWLKLERNTVEDEGVVEKAKHHVAPGVAMAFFHWIQNVVNGVTDEEGNFINKPHEEALRDYMRENEIESDNVWISEKIMILFPESEKIRASVKEISHREKEKGENHCLTLEQITHKYETAGQPRKSVLDVIKIQDNQITTYKKCSGKCNVTIGSDRTRTNLMKTRESPLAVPSGGLCEKLHEKKEWQNNYVIFAENRPLNTLHQMRDTPETQISFDMENFELQFELYYKELKKLIEEDEICRDKVELFRYHDYEERRKKEGNFSKQLKNQIKKMKMGSKARNM